MGRRSRFSSDESVVAALRAKPICYVNDRRGVCKSRRGIIILRGHALADHAYIFRRTTRRGCARRREYNSLMVSCEVLPIAPVTGLPLFNSVSIISWGEEGEEEAGR